jgi:hypothetical protein
MPSSRLRRTRRPHDVVTPDDVLRPRVLIPEDGVTPYDVVAPHDVLRPREGLSKRLDGTTPTSSHGRLNPVAGSMALASATAPAALIPPAPCSSAEGVDGSRSASGIAVYCRMALTVFGVSGLAAPSDEQRI